MRIEHGGAGGAVADHAIRRRWLAAALALFLAAGLLVVSPGTANAGGYSEGAHVRVKTSDCSATVKVKNTSGATLLVESVKVKKGPLSLNEDITSSGPEEIGDGEKGEYSIDGLPAGWYLAKVRYSIGGEIGVATEGSHSSIAYKWFHVGCSGVVTECGYECTIDNEDWDAAINCPTGPCRVVVRQGTTNPDGSPSFADLEINKTDVSATVTAEGRGTPPGRAAVWANGVLMRKCTGQITTDCAKIRRVHGGHTQYYVTSGDDIRYRFR